MSRYSFRSNFKSAPAPVVDTSRQLKSAAGSQVTGNATEISESDNRPKSNLQSIQFLRGIAAIAVVLFHTHIILRQPEYGSIDVFGNFAGKGWIGVNFFFILSGYIIALAHSSDIDKPHRAARYFWRRFARVYPLYWILLTAFIVSAWFGIGHPDFRWDFGNLFTAYSLLMVVDVPVVPLKVAWTLLFEIKFYLMFSLFIFSKKLGIIAFLVWFGALIVRSFFLPVSDWGYMLPDWGMLSVWNIYFMYGMVVFYLSTRVSMKLGPMLLAVGIALLTFAISGVHDMADNPKNIVLMIALGVPLSMIILGGSLAEQRFKFAFPKWTLLLGDGSYAIYLVHSAVISLLAGINNKIAGAALAQPLVFLAIFLIATMTGGMVHLMLERPLLRLARRPEGIFKQTSISRPEARSGGV